MSLKRHYVPKKGLKTNASTLALLIVRYSLYHFIKVFNLL